MTGGRCHAGPQVLWSSCHAISSHRLDYLDVILYLFYLTNRLFFLCSLPLIWELDVSTNMPLPLTTFALLAFASNVACWGGLGHRTVGYLAEHYFTEDAAQLVKDLIKPTDSFDISDAAIWADGIRQRHHYTEGWHFIGERLRLRLI
jgi:hypothetical protein